ncbi:MAG: CCR4-NOT transcription complex subunit 2 [Candelina submexicana]|nr:MAG: CCR4-NOT transcription complex subunit 2 [Candelina submexicana]
MRIPTGPKQFLQENFERVCPKLTLDISSRSEFPSLSSGPQPQHQNSSAQAVWANATQRAQQTPVQRPQQQPSTTQASIPPQQQQHQHFQQQAQQDEPFPSVSQFASALDDYRSGGQSGVGQLSGSAQPQTGSIDEFPPLGRNGNGDIGQDRRGGLMQNAGFGGHTNGNGFGPSLIPSQGSQGRIGFLGAMTGQQDGNRGSGIGDRIVSPAGLGSGGTILPRSSRMEDGALMELYVALSASRSPIDPLRHAQNGFPELDKSKRPTDINLTYQNALKPMQNGNTHNSLFSISQNHTQQSTLPQLSTRHGPFPDQQQRRQSHPSQSQQQQAFGNELVDSPAQVQTPESVPLSQMSELDRFGLAGLLSAIRNDNPDRSSLAIGQDLMTLGLDLNQPEYGNSPLYPNFGSPFAEQNSKMIEPDFNLPPCYAVHNVPSMPAKITGFADESLFFIFYTMTRDVMQVAVAEELYVTLAPFDVNPLTASSGRSVIGGITKAWNNG